MNITLKVTGAAKDLIADAGFDSKYGARPLRRAIQTKIEDEMATEILEGRIKAGDTVQVKVKDKKSVLYPRNHRSKKPFLKSIRFFHFLWQKEKK